MLKVSRLLTSAPSALTSAVLVLGLAGVLLLVFLSLRRRRHREREVLTQLRQRRAALRTADLRDTIHVVVPSLENADHAGACAFHILHRAACPERVHVTVVHYTARPQLMLGGPAAVYQARCSEACEEPYNDRLHVIVRPLAQAEREGLFGALALGCDGGREGHGPGDDDDDDAGDDNGCITAAATARWRLLLSPQARAREQWDDMLLAQHAAAASAGDGQGAVVLTAPLPAMNAQDEAAKPPFAVLQMRRGTHELAIVPQAFAAQPSGPVATALWSHELAFGPRRVLDVRRLGLAKLGQVEAVGELLAGAALDAEGVALYAPAAMAFGRAAPSARAGSWQAVRGPASYPAHHRDVRRAVQREGTPAVQRGLWRAGVAFELLRKGRLVPARAALGAQPGATAHERALRWGSARDFRRRRHALEQAGHPSDSEVAAALQLRWRHEDSVSDDDDSSDDDGDDYYFNRRL